MPTADPGPGGGADWPALVAYWCRELDHRAEDTNAVCTAALTLTGSGPGRDDAATTEHPGRRDDRVRRLVALDPLRDRPLLDEDPDGAVLVDILLTPLSAATTHYVAAAQRFRTGEPLWRDVDPLTAVATLLKLGSIYATPECRVRLEGRARYNLAFDAAALRAAHATATTSEPSTS